MGFARGPIFQLVPIDLSSAGSKTFHDVAGVVSFVRAEDTGKAEVLGAKVSVMLGDVVMDQVPLTTNSIIRIRKTVSLCKFTWDAQPGVTAYILVAPDEDVMIHSPPSRQLVTQSMASALAASAASIGTSAALVAAANGSRQKLTVKNNSASATIYLGADNAVTTASGFPLGPGEGFTFEGTTGAVYAIASAAGTDVRILAEG
ncbi:hypothetical protein [Paramagnetospirillum magneticum]|uniref:Uncharacterized protein n=1 Tax=Paramagnetospirillum magneticum (strain ATCC 700264 / AMB-1) TaxID=342108 RepID=Q2W4J2_PARM1|nr:hypothetical protein [Paramagnetospirillum magneticum]BAE51214.1 hypothetical protein amb2410 [Paramagnetospirillum magneticum AMB-1]BAE51233.1 hypothetical protein amb2429 [Paramagnetospirillum magneticum AMB-1]